MKLTRAGTHARAVLYVRVQQLGIKKRSGRQGYSEAHAASIYIHAPPCFSILIYWDIINSQIPVCMGQEAPIHNHLTTKKGKSHNGGYIRFDNISYLYMYSGMRLCLKICRLPHVVQMLYIFLTQCIVFHHEEFLSCALY